LERTEASHKRLRQELPGLKETIEYTRNEFGFRSISMKTKEKPPGTIRIICLGASTTDQNAQNTEDIWAGILETKLNEAFGDQGVQVETAALGHGGWKTRHILSWVAEKLLEFDPDIVITLVGINDLTLNGYPGYSYPGIDELLSAVSSEEAEKETGSWRLCRRVSQICRRLDLAGENLENWFKLKTGRRLQWHSKNLPNLRLRYQELPYVPIPTRLPDPIHEFSETLGRLLEFLREADIDVIVLGQPVIWRSDLEPEALDTLWLSVGSRDGYVRPSLSWMEREMARYNDTQQRQAELFDASYIDLDQRIPKEVEYYFDDCHFTDLGNQRVAAEAFPVVMKCVEQIINRE
jgi:lysophospholipase L1-like esterase